MRTDYCATFVTEMPIALVQDTDTSKIVSIRFSAVEAHKSYLEYKINHASKYVDVPLGGLKAFLDYVLREEPDKAYLSDSIILDSSGLTLRGYSYLPIVDTNNRIIKDGLTVQIYHDERDNIYWGSHVLKICRDDCHLLKIWSPLGESRTIHVDIVSSLEKQGITFSNIELLNSDFRIVDKSLNIPLELLCYEDGATMAALSGITLTPRGALFDDDFFRNAVADLRSPCRQIYVRATEKTPVQAIKFPDLIERSDIEICDKPDLRRIVLPKMIASASFIKFNGLQNVEVLASTELIQDFDVTSLSFSDCTSLRMRLNMCGYIYTSFNRCTIQSGSYINLTSSGRLVLQESEISGTISAGNLNIWDCTLDAQSRVSDVEQAALFRCNIANPDLFSDCKKLRQLQLRDTNLGTLSIGVKVFDLELQNSSVILAPFKATLNCCTNNPQDFIDTNWQAFGNSKLRLNIIDKFPIIDLSLLNDVAIKGTEDLDFGIDVLISSKSRLSIELMTLYRTKYVYVQAGAYVDAFPKYKRDKPVEHVKALLRANHNMIEAPIIICNKVQKAQFECSFNIIKRNYSQTLGLVLQALCPRFIDSSEMPFDKFLEQIKDRRD